MDIKKQALRYFDCFSNKDLKQLRSFFSNEVYLRDWEIEAKGIEEVMAANKNIFSSVDTIQVNPNSIYLDKNVIIAELEILINTTEKLMVVDIIKFDSLFKISSIKAFKG